MARSISAAWIIPAAPAPIMMMKVCGFEIEGGGEGVFEEEEEEFDMAAANWGASLTSQRWRKGGGAKVFWTGRGNDLDMGYLWGRSNGYVGTLSGR